jgi:hypothetical protein
MEEALSLSERGNEHLTGKREGMSAEGCRLRSWSNDRYAERKKMR